MTIKNKTSILVILFAIIFGYCNYQSEDSKSARFLFVAIGEGRIENVKKIITRNQKIINAPIHVLSPLQRAVIDCQYDIIKLLIRYGANINHIGGRHDFTPLHAAAANCDVDIVTLLLNNGAIINSKDTLGKTPLMNAIESGKLEVVKLLIQKGANVNISSSVIGKPLDYAVKFKQYKIISLLLKNEACGDIKTMQKIYTLKRNGTLN